MCMKALIFELPTQDGNYADCFRKIESNKGLDD